MRNNEQKARATAVAANMVAEAGADGGADEARRLEEQWQRVRGRLRAELGEDVYSSWFARVTPERLQGGTLYLTVPTRFLKSWIRSHYHDRLLALWRGEDRKVQRVDLGVRGLAQMRERGAEPALAANDSQPAAFGAGVGLLPGEGGAREGEPAIGSRLDPRYTFDSFIVGPSNALANAAARQIAASDGGDNSSFSVLFMHAGVGLGKTHLLQAIAHEAGRRRRPDRVVYLTAERFMYRFVAALKAQNALGFKDKLRGIDVLLIDDMQFLQGRSTQQELCHTLNALMESGRQVVVAADRPPAELDSLDDRMRSRLSAGLVVDIRPLGRSLRLSILKGRLEAARRRNPALHIADDVLEYVADQVEGNGRDLEGAFTRILAHNQLTNMAVTVEMAEHAIRDLVRTAEPRRVRIEHIQKIVAKHFNISRQDIVSSRRNRSIVRPRQISMYLAKTLTDRSFPEIGRRFGGRDHTTVLHAVRKIESLMKEDRAFADEVDLLKRLIED